MILARLAEVFGRPRGQVPYAVEELAAKDSRVDRLFRRSFGAPPPEEPRHFGAVHRATRELGGYIHFREERPGVFLLGGLCVDASLYRRLAPAERQAIARAGSLSRWLLGNAIAALGSKRAVFAYTGHAGSRRDCLALGFEPACGPYLLVQWHDAPPAERRTLADAIAARGPF